MNGVLVTLLLASGCDVVFSLDRPPTPADAPPPGPDIATATFTRRILNAPGAAIVEADAPDSVTASVVLENGARPEVVRDGSDFHFAWTRGMKYHLTFFRPGRGPLEYISDAERLHHAQRELAADDAPVPAAGSRLDVTMTNTTLQAVTFVMSTGVWTMNANGATLGTHSIDWTSPASFLTGRPGLLRNQDRLYCTGFQSVTDGFGVGNLSYIALKRLDSKTVAMNDGAPTSVMCNLVDQDLSECAAITTDRTRELARVDMAANPTFTTPSFGTYVLAFPDPTFGPWLSLWLAYQAGNAAVTPFNGTLHYANPFPQHPPAIYTAMSRVRLVQATGAQKPVAVGVGTFQFNVPNDDCTAGTTFADISMPSPPAIGGAQLLQDTELHLSKTRPIELSWEDGTPGVVDYYQIILSRLVVRGPDTALEEVKVWLTTDKALTMEPDLLDSDHQFMISITSYHSALNAAMGDFVTSRWPQPLWSANNYSSVFTVAP